MRAPIFAFLCLLAAAPAFAQPNYGGSVGGFPNWEERVIAQLTNRARVDPAADLANCPAGNCPDAACYSARAPLFWNYDLNQAARFHSASMGRFPFFAHDTPCQLFADIDTRYPGTSDGSFASSCSGSGTTPAGSRVNLFGAGYGGENIAAGVTTPHDAFYGWLHEATNSAACTFTFQNGHRYNILNNGGPALGVGYATVQGSPYTRYWTQDFGGSGTMPKIPSGSHWTVTNRRRDPTVSDNNVEFWANWRDTVGGAPTTATVVLDNVAIPMTLQRGTATSGAYRAIVNGVSTACHSYYFSFIDSSAAVVRYPQTGTLGFGSGCPDFQDGGIAPAAPTGVTATATSSSQVQVSWNVVAGATSYEVYRRAPGGAYLLRGTSATPPYNDGATANQAYLYRVRAVNAGGTSSDSAADLATTVDFTNDPLAPGLVVRAAHLAELRTAVNAVRAQAGLPAATFTDSAAIGVPIRAVHITQVRSNLDAAMSALGFTTGGWTDASLTGVAVKATHFQEVRNRVR